MPPAVSEGGGAAKPATSDLEPTGGARNDPASAPPVADDRATSPVPSAATDARATRPGSGGGEPATDARGANATGTAAPESTAAQRDAPQPHAQAQAQGSPQGALSVPHALLSDFAETGVLDLAHDLGIIPASAHADGPKPSPGERWEGGGEEKRDGRGEGRRRGAERAGSGA
ncbi:unnamed protein product [Closterium sp. NIES-53]